jgi:signal transduction histidine kinase
MTIPGAMIFRAAGIKGYPLYYEWLVGERLRPAVRVASLFVVGLNSFFLLLDAWVYPEKLMLFAALRLSWIATMLGVFFSVKILDPLWCTRIACLVTGFFLIALSGVGGGVASPYWPALMILFLGMPVLMPLTATHSAGIVSVLTVAFALLPIMMGEPIDGRSYAVPVFFVVSAAIECVMSAAVLDGMRFSDFESRIQVEEARDHLREMDKAKTRFTANIHHELRTPLTMILSPLAALRSGEYGELPNLIGSAIATMEVNGRRLHKLINNLLDLAKLESQQFTIQRRPMSLKQLVEDVVTGITPMADRKHVLIRVDGFDNLGPLFADVDAIDKVLVNLVGNALKFTDEGGEITIWAGPAPGGGSRLEMRDSGIGIPKEQLGRIFDRFAQIDGSSTRRYEGTGIGLSLASELIEMHSGRIWAESPGLGFGTTICFELPQGSDDSRDQLDPMLVDTQKTDLPLDGCSTRTHALSDAEIDSADPASDRAIEIERTVDRWLENSSDDEPIQVAHPISVPEILVAEDNPDMRRLLQFLLSKKYRVRVAKNGREALEFLRTSHPHVVVSDVMMPEMSGTELCAAIKQDPTTQHIPVILVTSKAESEMKIEGLELGADDYITKPFHPRELLARVSALARVRLLQEELESQNKELEIALQELKETQMKLVRNERLAAVGEMAAGVAHEVNNPVNFALNAVRVLQSEVEGICEAVNIIGEGSLARAGRSPNAMNEIQGRVEEIDIEETASTIKELAGIVADGLERTHRLVSELHNFSGSNRCGDEDIDLCEGIRSTVALLRPTLSSLGVEITVNTPRDLPTVRGDAGALNQVLMNIIKNAGEAAADGRGEIRIDATAESRDVVIRIVDNGPGIDDQSLSRVFEPFFSTKAAGKGTGLGLPISRQIAEECGGSLSVESEVGTGTTIALRLPRSDASPGLSHA